MLTRRSLLLLFVVPRLRPRVRSVEEQAALQRLIDLGHAVMKKGA